LFLLADQSICGTVSRRPGRTANAVHIVFPVVRHIKIDDQINIIDINPAA
jgi:hypothetical protein